MTDENTQDTYNAKIDECIEMFKILQNSTLALDACYIQGKIRSMILKDERYIRETRAIKAKQAVDELTEVNNIYAMIDKASKFDDEYIDERDGKAMNKATKSSMNDKDTITMKLKAAQMRRDLLSELSDSSDDEADGINFFFCTVTREEMEEMKRVEIHYGEEDDDDVFEQIISEGSTPPPAKKTGKVTTKNRPKAIGSSKGKDVAKKSKELHSKKKTIKVEEGIDNTPSSFTDINGTLVFED